MRIQTKFDVTDRVYTLYQNKVEVVEIKEIRVTCGFSGKNFVTNIEYGVRFDAGGTARIHEDKLFENKQALVNSL